MHYGSYHQGQCFVCFGGAHMMVLLALPPAIAIAIAIACAAFTFGLEAQPPTCPQVCFTQE